jgi:hypothetical protein
MRQMEQLICLKTLGALYQLLQMSVFWFACDGASGSTVAFDQQATQCERITTRSAMRCSGRRSISLTKR